MEFVINFDILRVVLTTCVLCLGASSLAQITDAFDITVSTSMHLASKATRCAFTVYILSVYIIPTRDLGVGKAMPTEALRDV